MGGDYWKYACRCLLKIDQWSGTDSSWKSNNLSSLLKSKMNLDQKDLSFQQLNAL